MRFQRQGFPNKEIVEAVSCGRKTPAEIARLLKLHRATVTRIVSQARVGV